MVFAWWLGQLGSYRVRGSRRLDVGLTGGVMSERWVQVAGRRYIGLC